MGMGTVFTIRRKLNDWAMCVVYVFVRSYDPYPIPLLRLHLVVVKERVRDMSINAPVESLSSSAPNTGPGLDSAATRKTKRRRQMISRSRLRRCSRVVDMEIFQPKSLVTSTSLNLLLPLVAGNLSPALTPRGIVRAPGFFGDRGSLDHWHHDEVAGIVQSCFFFAVCVNHCIDEDTMNK